MGNSVDVTVQGAAYAQACENNQPEKRREGVAEMDDSRFPPTGYRLDGSDPDVLVLRRGDGTFVAAFSALGATREAIQHAAEDDRRT